MAGVIGFSNLHFPKILQEAGGDTTCSSFDGIQNDDLRQNISELK